MANIRVYELARDLNMKNKALLEKLKDMEVPVRSHMSSLDEDTVLKVKSNLRGKSTGDVQATRVKPTVIRRRKRTAAEEAAESEAATAETAEATAEETEAEAEAAPVESDAVEAETPVEATLSETAAETAPSGKTEETPAPPKDKQADKKTVKKAKRLEKYPAKVVSKPPEDLTPRT